VSDESAEWEKERQRPKHGHDNIIRSKLRISILPFRSIIQNACITHLISVI